MHAATAYFVGAGTIVAAIAMGLGGGIVAGNILNPTAPKQGTETSKMERRADAATPARMSERVQYLTGSQAFGAMIAVPVRAHGEAMPDTQTGQATAESPAPQPSQAAAIEAPKEQVKPAPASRPQAAAPAEQQTSTEPATSPDSAFAKARDSDVKRAASERRRAERRERWAERHRPREPRSMRDRTDWDDVARNVREDSDSGDNASRPRAGFPRIMLFGRDDD